MTHDQSGKLPAGVAGTLGAIGSPDDVAGSVGVANGVGVGVGVAGARRGAVADGAADTDVARAEGCWATSRCGAGRGAAVVVAARGCAGTLSVRGGGGLTTGTVEAGSAGRVRVPGRLKFCNSRGPTASVGGASVGGGAAVFCAIATVAGTRVPNASNMVVKRNPALISSRSVLGRRHPLARRAASMPATSPLFKHGPDERWRNLAQSTA